MWLRPLKPYSISPDCDQCHHLEAYRALPWRVEEDRCSLVPFSLSYLEAEVPWNFSSKSLDQFLSSLRVAWKPSHLVKSWITSVDDLEISWVALTSLFVVLYLCKCIYVTSYGTFDNTCTKDSQSVFSSLINVAWRQTPETGSGVVAFTDLAAQLKMQNYKYWYTFCHL